MTRHFDVISIGETTLDAFMTLHDVKHNCRYDTQEGMICFKHGSKIDVDRYDFSMGGNATNVAVGLSRLGLKVTLFSEIGDDEFSLKIRNSLARENIDRMHVIQSNGASSFSVIFNFKGDRTIFVEDVERKHEYRFAELSARLMYLTSMGKDKSVVSMTEFLE